MIPTVCLLLSLFDWETLTPLCVVHEPVYYCDRSARVWTHDRNWGHAPTLKFCRPDADKLEGEVEELTHRMREYIRVPR